MIFFNSFSGLVRVLVVAVFAYIGLIFFQRISGKRTLSKMNAFDLVITVALGSSLATAILSRSVALLEGLLAFAALMGLQLLVSWLSVRSSWVEQIVKASPTLVFYQGKFLKDAMRQERVVEDEILQAIRSTGIANISDVEAVVLETNGDFSVVKRSKEEAATSLKNVS